MTSLSILTLAQDSGGSGGNIAALLFGGVFFIIWLAVLAVIFVSLWKLFEKAGRPGWEGIVPIYNLYILITKIALQPWWLILVFLAAIIPLVGALVALAAMVFININVAKNFGKGIGFAIGLTLLGIVFYPILAFGPARFNPVSKPLTI